MVKALGPEESLPRMEKAYQTETRCSEIRLGVSPLWARPTARSSRKEAPNREEKLNDKQETSPKRLDRTWKPRVERVPEESLRQQCSAES